jgi:hypothetical protein
MYVYQADTWCDSCGERIRRDLEDSGQAPEDPSDEWSFDSDDFPKYGAEEPTDSPDHCASQGDCLEGVDLGEYGLPEGAPLFGAETRTIGALLSDGLTDEGASWLIEVLSDDQTTPYQSALHAYWADVFSSEVHGARLKDAACRGIADGVAAGSWFVDGNTPADSARETLRRLEAGDPEVLDYLPSAPLSGEWADGLLPRDVLGWYGLGEDDDDADEILEAYEMGYSQGAEDEVRDSLLRAGYLRSVTIDGWRIRSYYAGFDSFSGKTRIGYTFGRAFDTEAPLFEGEDFYASPLHADDSDEAVRALLGFLTLRPGDTDAEYFEGYTPEQLAFSEEHAEGVAVSFGLHEHDDEEGTAPPLVDDWTRRQVGSGRQ